MPITRKQFELEIDTEIEKWMEKIRAFLVEHKDVAFSRTELWETLCGKGEEWEAWVSALDKLVELAQAEKRIIRDTNYYAYGEEIPF